MYELKTNPALVIESHLLLSGHITLTSLLTTTDTGIYPNQNCIWLTIKERYDSKTEETWDNPHYIRDFFKKIKKWKKNNKNVEKKIKNFLRPSYLTDSGQLSFSSVTHILYENVDQLLAIYEDGITLGIFPTTKTQDEKA